ncbi:hypothetical protein SAMN05660297_02636 [Natronincola peptidivorans]|uniref:Uncharacterized protein n=1 Tax=Natronincola peptidivorans TaxID=426128 RepID=A0A1I0F2A1_9FIRM|nr:DUF6512 family protein [Natronincola peptidivorans]SET51766.1 hypothetical protein SAMN05660297_02636 [Natronincola peptidivorans]
MKKNIKKWTKWGIVLIIIWGVLLHFVYEWSDENAIVGIFGAVNESTWEHLKLLFWPAFIFSIIEFMYIGKHYSKYITGKAISFYVGILMIITLFYTYTGIIGKNYVVVDITIFIISVVISQYIGYKIITAPFKIKGVINVISVLAIILLILAFVFFTFNPPHIPLFKDPKTGGYGI